METELSNIDDIENDEVSENDELSELSETEETTPQNFIDNMSFEDALEFEQYVYESIDEYTTEHIGKMHSNHFHENLIQDISIKIVELLDDFDECSSQDDDYAFVTDFVKLRADIFFDTISSIPNRSCKERFAFAMHKGTVGSGIGSCKGSGIDPCKGRFVFAMHKGTVGSCKQIEYLRAIPQPVQRTKAWYEFRYNLITASNVGKLFSSESQYNSLICEKCKPLDYASSLGNCSVDSPMHWGTKYEPLTIMLYEKMYQTKIEDFGCIKHPKYACIGASPDGINVDPASPLYGRMLEVKNIVNREINGIPSDMYWIQMQVQMETCDLDDCDFIETQFKEYGEDEFYSDLEHKDSEREYSGHEYQGVVLYFVKKQTKVFTTNVGYNVPHYVFMPLSIELNKESVDQWIAQKKEDLRDTYTLYTAQYWYLDKMSCVLVQRNKEWFNESVSKIVDAWAIIEKERVSGWDHRLPKKYRVRCDEVASTLTQPKVEFEEPTVPLYEPSLLHLCTFKTPTSSAVMSEQGDADCAFIMRNGVKNNICIVKLE